MAFWDVPDAESAAHATVVGGRDDQGARCVPTGLMLIVVTVTTFTQGTHLEVIAMPPGPRHEGHPPALPPPTEGMGQARPPGAAEGARLPVPGDHPTDRQLRQEHPPGQPCEVITIYIPEYVVGH
ncbi:hypothetical protein [Rhodococcus olei]|uniref:hypothetical protein n=1 Tax=Rhodococcus olei TaxID=2161675 RepID=UPI003CD09E2D